LKKPTNTNKKGATAHIKRVGADSYNSDNKKEPPFAKAKAVKVKQLKIAEK
jgi:hypothetical protein